MFHSKEPKCRFVEVVNHFVSLTIQPALTHSVSSNYFLGQAIVIQLKITPRQSKYLATLIWSQDLCMTIKKIPQLDDVSKEKFQI